MTSIGNSDTDFGRDQAWQLLTEWTQSESLRKHAIAVEICVTACGEAEADRLGLSDGARQKFVELYTTTGLLHDFDYERHPTPEEHPFVGVRELERQGWPAELRTAILGHAQYSGVPASRISTSPFSPATNSPAFSLRAPSSSPPRQSPTSKSPACAKR